MELESSTTFDIFEITKLWKFNIMAMEKSEMEINLFCPVYFKCLINFQVWCISYGQSHCGLHNEKKFVTLFSYPKEAINYSLI